MFPFILSLLAFVNYAVARTDFPWAADNFDSLITFGDSYTDENRLGYFINNNGSAPPPGTYLPESYSSSTGGRNWARYVIQYTGDNAANGSFTPAITLYNYAVSGAVCSNNISPRTFSYLNADFPAVAEYEIPAFLADKESLRTGTDQPYFTPALTATNAVYAMWIGTNDLGNDAFFTDSQVLGKTLTDYVECVYSGLDSLYQSGARYFVLMNLAPLDLLPQYANETQNGLESTQFWPNKSGNITRISEIMREYTSTVNTVYRYQTGYEVLAGNRYPGANFALFDVNTLITDIYRNPTAYLNGTLPANVTGYDNQCNNQGSNCKRSNSPDSFLWYDPLHPSEQTDRIIAENFVDILNGNSQYASYYSAPN